jgi:magnesium chelatase subunit I
VPRVLDIYSALPAMTGKLELEYEGELKGGDAVAHELIRVAVGKVYNRYFEGSNMAQIVQWFDLGGSLKLDEGVDAATMVKQLGGIQGLMEKTKALGLSSNEPDAVRASAAEFVLEGLHAHRRISRSEERGYAAEEKKREVNREEAKPERPNFRRQYN